MSPFVDLFFTESGAQFSNDHLQVKREILQIFFTRLTRVIKTFVEFVQYDFNLFWNIYVISFEWEYLAETIIKKPKITFPHIILFKSWTSLALEDVEKGNS